MKALRDRLPDIWGLSPVAITDDRSRVDALLSVGALDLTNRFIRLLNDPISSEVTIVALQKLNLYFSSGPEATGSKMIGRAESGRGDPQQVAAAFVFLAQDIIEAIAAEGFDF